MYLFLTGAYVFICFKVISSLKNMNNYKAKERTEMSKPQQELTFRDIGGCQKAKDAILEIIDYIKNPEEYRSQGVRMPKGVLLFGPPGTGKTLIAKAAAAEAQIPVIFASGSEFVELFVGMGAKRIRDLFTQARKISPCMIFIDEIDAIGFSRTNSNFIVGGGHREMETTLNQLLNEMDGFEVNDSIVVVAATNLDKTLDPALLRPGRFDHKIQIDLPSMNERKEIIRIHLRNKKHSIEENQIVQTADKTEGLSGAEIENVINLAALTCIRKARTSSDHADSVLNGVDLNEQVKIFLEEKKRQG